MKQKLAQAVGYICNNYPHKEELSNARVTKMIYLADWRSSVQYGRQITEIEWTFNHYGPYVDDVIDVAYMVDWLDVRSTSNMYGSPKRIIAASKKAPIDLLTREGLHVLDYVISVTAPKYWKDFMKLVYSTYPIVTEPRYTVLDLPQLANDYKARLEVTDALAE